MRTLHYQLHYQLTQKSLRIMREEKFKEVYATTTLTSFRITFCRRRSYGRHEKGYCGIWAKFRKDVILELIVATKQG